MLQTEQENVDFDGSYVFCIEDENKKVSLEEIGLKSTFFNNIELQVVKQHSSPLSPPPFMVGMVEVEVDKETGEVVKKGEVKGVTPIFETKLYNEDGTELKGEGKGTVIVGVKLTNKEKLDKYSIEIKNSKGEKIEADTTTIGEGEVSFTIEENGKYTIIVKGTKDGTERTNQRTIEIDVGEKIITNIEIRPNGGAKYIVPTEGKAKIKGIGTVGYAKGKGASVF